jgi:8-amino-7-oxononanoate synthase
MNESFYQSLRSELEMLKQAHRFRHLRTGASNGLVNLSGNDYLGISARQDWIAEFLAANTPASMGMSAVSSRLLTGNHDFYPLLEQELSAFYNGRAALVFNSGYHANSGIIPALAAKGDLILSDKLNHASIIDGMMLSGAEFRRYRHLDYGHLEEMLKERAAGCRRVLVVTESIYSMDGDVADLKILVELCRKYGALLYVDEAHSVGVRGARGAGCCEESGLTDEIDVIVGTLGKAFCSTGAYAIVRPELKDYLINCTRPFIFTTAMPPVNVNWTRFVLGKLPAMRQERENLRTLAEYLRRGLEQKGLRTLGDSQVVPLIVGENGPAEELSLKLRENGYLALPVRPPTVPPGTARLRFSLHAGLKQDQLTKLLELL